MGYKVTARFDGLNYFGDESDPNDPGLHVGGAYKVWDDSMNQDVGSNSMGFVIPIAEATNSRRLNRAILEATAAAILTDLSVSVDPEDIFFQGLFG